MSMPWWGWVALVVALAAGVALIFSPLFGRWLAGRDVWTHCPRCGRELVGYPPEHCARDRLWCRQLAEREGDRP